MSTRHSVDLLAARDDAHLPGHRTSGLTSLETTPAILLETSGSRLLAVDMVVRRRDSLRRLSDHDDDGWQVTLCDPIWHVCFRSGEAFARTAIHDFSFLFVQGYIQGQNPGQISSVNAL